MASSSTAVPIQTYSPNERVLCYHGPLIYEAKVLKVENWDETSTKIGTIGPHYFVHYKGWKQTWVAVLLYVDYFRMYYWILGGMNGYIRHGCWSSTRPISLFKKPCSRLTRLLLPQQVVPLVPLQKQELQVVDMPQRMAAALEERMVREVRNEVEKRYVTFATQCCVFDWHLLVGRWQQETGNEVECTWSTKSSTCRWLGSCH